jgi:2',3'-cyclic-nucleotide 2'-phosphodiesterase (5'-nucleotidase family)
MIPIQNREIVYENKHNEENQNFNYLRIIAFNDVYNIESGSSRFFTAIEQIRSEQKSLLLFAGDAVSPSTLSLFAKGDQMISVLNEFKIDAAAIGILITCKKVIKLAFNFIAFVFREP